MQLHTGKREAAITDTGRQYQHFLGRWSTLLFMGPLVTFGSLYTSCSYCNVWRMEQEEVLDTIQRFNLGIVTLVQGIYPIHLSIVTPIQNHKAFKRRDPKVLKSYFPCHSNFPFHLSCQQRGFCSSNEKVIPTVFPEKLDSFNNYSRSAPYSGDRSLYHRITSSTRSYSLSCIIDYSAPASAGIL